MKKIKINLDEMLGQEGQVTQLFRIIAKQTLLPMQIRVRDPGGKWSITMTIEKYGKYSK